MKKNRTILLMLIALCFIFSGVSAEEAVKPVEEKSHIGTVKSAQTAGNYTYLLLEEEGKEVWIATMPSLLRVPVRPGDKVEYLGGSTQNNFESTALGKTFETINFVARIHVLDKEMPADDYHKKAPSKAENVAPPKAGDIKKAENGKTVSELFAESDTLKGKEVTVRAKVMKISKNVLKKNWLTLQDGTGTPPDDKLTATTQETPNPGDTVVLRGTLKTNVDIGAGYQYKILLEDAAEVK